METFMGVANILNVDIQRKYRAKIRIMVNL